MTENGKRRARSIVPLLSLAALFGAAIAGAFAFDLPPWAQKMATDWGPGFIILGGLAAGITRYVPRGVVGDFVRAQQDQAVALSGIKDSIQVIAGQNGKLDEIKGLLEDSLINDRVIFKKFEILEQRLGHGSEDRE